MSNRKITVFLLTIALSVSLIGQTINVYATENTETEESTEDDKTSEDKDTEKTEEEEKKERTDALEESIKEKQDALSQAKEERNSLQKDLTDVKKKVSDLENTKNNLNEYVEQLDSNLSDVQGRIESLQELIQEKEISLMQSEADLQEAERLRDDQYEAMKSRIKFMYEKGNNYYAELLLSSKSFGDIINKADFIEKLSEYDQKMLLKFKYSCEYIEACKEALQAEKDVLDEAKAQIEAEEENLNVLISAKEEEIARTESDISNKEQAIKEYEAYIAEQATVIKALEAAVKEEQRKLAEENGEIITYDGGGFCWPAPSYTKVTSEYGNRFHPTLGVNQFHNGVDLAAPGGSPILAAYDGEVSAAAYSSTMGNYIILNHGDGVFTIYMHASALYVNEGAKVTRGQKIAAVGTTGRSTGNHLHFSVRVNGSYVSPWSYISTP